MEHCNRLHIVFVTKEWSQMQNREFVAANIQKRKFYRVHEQLGAWMASFYCVKTIEKDELARLFDTAVKCELKTSEPINDWESFAVALQDTEIVEITKAQLLPGSEF